MKDLELAHKIVKKMYENDKFSQWLGIEIVEVTAGLVIIKMQIKEDMLNGFEISHGGIIFAFADSAFAFASNSHNRKSLSIEASIKIPKSIKLGDVIYAKAEEKSLTNKTAIYDVNVTNNDELVALFRGTVYRTSKEWFENE